MTILKSERTPRSKSVTWRPSESTAKKSATTTPLPEVVFAFYKPATDSKGGSYAV